MLLVCVLAFISASRGQRGGNALLKTQNICTVEISPDSVQIKEGTSIVDCSEGSERQRQEQLESHNVRSIPRTDVEDVILAEIVLSYKVLSCIMFRVRTESVKDTKRKKCNVEQNGPVDKNKLENEGVRNGDAAAEFSPTIGEEMMIDGAIELIPAFTPDRVEMTYVECQKVLEGMIKALGKK